MTRHKKAPEFQCHVKYRNELPLPPTSPLLLDASLTLPMEDLGAALNEASAYKPTSLEQGVRHFSLPSNLLRSSLFDWVDLDRFRGTNRAGLPEDKELFAAVDGSAEGSSSVSVSMTAEVKTGKASSTPSSTSTKPKFARPEVTWLRRTEYISSLRPAAAISTVLTTEEAKASLAEAVEFDQIVAEVQETFTVPPATRHPHKPEVTLVQSFPLRFDDSQPLAHCLFLGESGATIEEHSLLLERGASTVTLLTANSAQEYQMPADALQFEIQRTTEEAGKRTLVLMLPMEGNEQNGALLASIGATFALRKRRRERGSVQKKKKLIKVNRQ